MNMLATEINISGYYVLEKLYDSSRTLVYRAVREHDQKPVVIKLLKNPHPSFSELLQFRNQYSIAKNINFPGIIQTYSLEPYKNGFSLVMEDIGGISLNKYFTNIENISSQNNIPSSRFTKVFLQEFLQIAISLCDTLDALYHHKIIHKDIKPANILINPETKQIKLIDFSIASLLNREIQNLTNPSVLEGTLAYISPEQTGRMNRGIDYRTDFYSLGVTFYELLTGELPFKSEDVMELVHCHIAEIPPSINRPHPNPLLIKERGQEIREVLSDMIVKLMAKNAEDRYQSALGLKYDLEICLKQLQETGAIKYFQIAQRDVCERFIIPEKLYGRETEVQELLAAFERASKDKSELMLVAGFSGIGKTAIINEVHKPIVKQNGYFIKGKFDQFNRNTPLDAFVQAFRDLMGQLLSETDAQLSTWKGDILEALGDSAGVIVNVIPELEQIIGKQPPVAELSGAAVQNRFNLLFKKFIQIFTTKEHPLVIFLDDLQWSDSASLNLVQLLMSEPESKYLLLISAYRDNEVFPAHPLKLTLSEIAKTEAIVNTISLTPLKEESLNQLISDTLNCSQLTARPLTQLIYQKTKGNPFFSTQFLKSLYEDNLIKFDSPQSPFSKEGSQGGWICDISKVKALAVTDDVVELMAQQLYKLPIETQNVLKLAACVGNQFDLDILAIISENSKADTLDALWKALLSGLILPTNESYKLYIYDESQNKNAAININGNINNPRYRFLHDRVQQAAYSLIPDHQKQITHFKLGQLLLESFSLQEREEKIFDIVNQLNFGLDLIVTKSQKEGLARLNLIAGKKAKISTAYVAAFKYFAVGRDLLGEEGWHFDYELTLALYEESAETAYLNTDFDAAEQLSTVVLKKAKTLLDKINIYVTKIHGNIAQVKLLEAVKIALNVLNLIDKNINLPQQPLPSDFNKALLETQSNLTNKSIADLLHLPQMEDPYQLAAMRILASVAPAAYISFPKLLPLIAMKMVNLSVEFGNTSSSAFGYAMYGFILCGLVNEIESGSQFGQLALNLVNKFNSKDIESKVLLLVGHFIKHWRESVYKSLPLLTKAYQVGLEAGDLEFAGFSAAFYCFDCILIGKELESLETEISAYGDAVDQLKQEHILHQIYISRQTVLNLLDRSEHTCDLVGEAYNESQMISVHEQANDRTTLALFYIAKLKLCYLFNEYDQAAENAARAQEYLDGVVAMVCIVSFYFYDSLVKLARYENANKIEQSQISEQVEQNQIKMQYWANNAPQNCLHKFHLVEAEKYRILGNKAEAIELYDKAINGAKENNFIHEEALANEKAAEFYLNWDKEKIAESYIQKSYFCYAKWGSLAKINDLEVRYTKLLIPILEAQYSNNGLLNKTSFESLNQSVLISQQMHTNRSSSTISEALDFSSIIKATQALSSEIQLKQLISKLMQLVMENAGAKKAALLLHKDNELILEALSVNNQDVTLLGLPSANSEDIPNTVINYVKRSLKTVVLDNAVIQNDFIADEYLRKQQIKSLLCMPILDRSKLVGVLYLENKLTIGAFTRNRINTLNLLCTQAAISLENAKLYSQLDNYSHILEQKVQERTEEVTKKAAELESTLAELQRTQSQLIQTEKMSGLGQLVAGIAHEINNPINFIYGNLVPANEYALGLIDLINLYQKFYPQTLPEIESKIYEIDLDFVIYDLPKLLDSMKIGTQRIREIISSFKNFSRLDEAKMKPVNIHSGIDSTLLVLQHKLTFNTKHQEIEVIKQYSQLPKVNCYASELNQVFMNIISNAVDALREKHEKKPKIIISTSIKDGKNVLISIKDNGIGINKSIINNIFNPFFTTKPVGSGTGLGLSTSYSIIVDKHRGNLSCNSTDGEGTEFIIELPLNYQDEN
ncbi:multi-sensor signal transduction multi-kinase [Calothrix parasitica NIES-267]|uniref:histidine kinase n=1 Tax=Calothrix parasitica NIES-267 TaxID=1973488 RepID=A0A1Z4M186_9CYAN|nr:multi-sensor signal transduction multi-kinase [Calothrix parasitica NIES-267]